MSENICRFCDTPLTHTFVDLGMSHYGKTFCSERGEVIPLQMDLAFSDGESVRDKRHSWFKKPFALLLSPFAHSIWLDLDCEVLGSLAPLFSLEGEVLLEGRR